MKPKYETVRAWGYTTEDGSLDAYSQPDKGDLGCHLQVRVIRERDWRRLLATMREYEAIIKDHEPEWQP